MASLVDALLARPLAVTVAASVLVLFTQFIYKGYRRRAYFRNLVSDA